MNTQTTERVIDGQLLAERERIQAQFAQIQRMSDLGQLATGVAHDFNNTLAGILGRAQLLLDTRDPQKVRDGLQIIIKSAKDGANIVRRIQDFARRPHYQDFQLVDVNELLADVAEITRPRWKTAAEAANVCISFSVRCPHNLIIYGDESELREVLVNLIFNAVDAMPNGGELLLSATQTNDIVEISLADTGTGMPEETRKRVFEPFFTTKHQVGLGLGLSVSYEIIMRHKGSFSVESQLGLGTTFRIRLPVPDATRPSVFLRHLQHNLVVQRDRRAA